MHPSGGVLRVPHAWMTAAHPRLYHMAGLSQLAMATPGAYTKHPFLNQIESDKRPSRESSDKDLCHYPTALSNLVIENICFNSFSALLYPEIVDLFILGEGGQIERVSHESQ